MRAYHLDAFGDLDGLTVREHDRPEPGPREVLVRIRAASLNQRDLLILGGRYPVPAQAGIIPLSDGAGDVVSSGAAVSRVRVGDRVTSVYFPRWIAGRLTLPMALEQFGCSRDGMLAEFAVVHEDALVHVPAHLTFEEAATLPCAALTAWSSLTEQPRPVLPGDTVLTLGTGGVGLFALQFAKLFGARAIAITSSDEKASRLRELGADEVTNYRSTPDWDRAVLDLTSGRGVEHVVESVGPETWERSIRSAATDGQLAFVTAVGPAEATLDPRVLAATAVTIRRLFVGSRAAFEEMNRAIALHHLRPAIDRVFAFDAVRDAYRHYASRAHVGKVVISVP